MASSSILLPRNGHTLVAGIVARIGGCANQTELSLEDGHTLEDQIARGKAVTTEIVPTATSSRRGQKQKVVIFLKYSNSRLQTQNSAETQKARIFHTLAQKGIDYSNAVVLQESGVRGDLNSDRRWRKHGWKNRSGDLQLLQATETLLLKTRTTRLESVLAQLCETEVALTADSTPWRFEFVSGKSDKLWLAAQGNCICHKFSR